MSDKWKKKVLVVDDSAFHLARIREILEESGHEILECNGGKDAIEVIDRERDALDLLITDLEMPNMSGFELLKWVKEQPYGSKLSTLVLTGAYDLTRVVDNLKDLGVNAVLEKGGHPHHIFSRVNALLFPEVVEKRQFDRVSVHLPALFELEGERYDAVITNISLGGCFMVTKQHARADDVLPVLITLPVDDRKLELSGMVTWVIGGQEWHGRKRNIEGMGLKWADLSDEARITLEAFIEDKFKEERLYSLLSP